MGLSRNARPLLKVVGGVQHATPEDHEQENHNRQPDSSDDDDDDDDDNDTSGLGGLPKKMPTRLHVPPRTNKRVTDTLSPAKRKTPSQDNSDDAIFSQPSQPKRIKTFSRKHSSQPKRPEKKASFKESNVSEAQSTLLEPPKKKGFQARPSAEPSSSQAEPLSETSDPAFRHPKRLAPFTAESTAEASGQSQPIVLDSSQLSPPPSSPLSSVYDLELEQDAEIADKNPPCPICGEKVEKEFWDKFQDDNCHRRMNLRLQEKFCQAHKARGADDIWKDRGYPKIDWSTLHSRLAAHHNHLQAILDHEYESPYYQQHAKMVSSSKGHTARSAMLTGQFTGLRAGYYGTKGEKIMGEHIVRIFSDKLRNLSKIDPLIASGGASGGLSGFVHAILVPELAVGLIMEDMDCDRDEARSILAESADVGEMMNEEEDEKVPRIEIDLLDARSLDNDGGNGQTQTQKPRKGFRLA